VRRAETSFALARALWESRKDRTRADLLAQGARDAYARGGLKTELAGVDGWLASRK
jgi:hypothetical protein